VQLVDPGGRVLASIGPSAGINLPGTVLSLATDGSEASEGAASIGLPMLGGWRTVATAPLPVTDIPFPTMAALFGLIGLLVWFAWWMGRQIIRPAAVLESERDRLHGLYENAREASLADSLTGLGNHRAFQEAVARMVEQSRRYGNTFSLILLDIDEFKQVNDTRGHSVGDDLLVEVGNLIRAVIRGSDAGFRIGGDEFAVLLAETDAGGAAIAARRILSRGLEARGTGRYGASISFSAGVSSCPALGTTRAELTAQADAALYRGKRAGRTVVTVFDPNEDRGHVDEGMRAELSASIAAVIESGRLRPVYQPIVHLPTGRILGYEGLIRVDPASGFPHTGALFDAAEVAGRVLDLDRAALEVVLRGATGLPEQTLLSLNVSPRSFEAPEFNATVFLAILQRHGMAPDRVILELTEREAIRNADRLREAIHTLQGAGVRVAADDVGAGNAGLRLLSQFRFDVVKIDLSFVQGGANEDQTMGVLTSLVGMARRWGALTIAEGVETAEQLRMIRGLEIDAGQGYLLGRPGPITDNADMDLDALADAIQVGTAKTAPPASGLAGVRPQASAAASAGRGPASRARSSGGSGSTEPVLTAAALIASGAPNPFAQR
jgi:diguanylate cyclase (GGDEF)-like protein